MGNRDLPHHRARKEEIQRLSNELSSFNPNVREHALQGLYELLFRPFVGFAYRIVRNREDAEDAVSKVFNREFTDPRYIEGRGSFPSLMFASIRSACLDHLRAAHPTDSLDDHDDVTLTEHLPPEDDPLSAVIAHDDQQHVIAALAHLPNNQRTLLIWHYYQDKTLIEIAELLDLSSASGVHARIRKALDALKKQLRKGGVHV